MALVELDFSIEWDLSGVECFNTGTFEYDDASLDPTSAAGVLVVAIQDNILSELSNEITLVSVAAGDDSLGGISTSGVPGGAAAASLPPNCSYGGKKIVTTGRNGRWFVPGVPEANVDETGLVNAPARAAFEAGLNQMLADCTAGGVTLKVEQNAAAAVPIVSFVVPPYITRQSRRLDRARGF